MLANKQCASKKNIFIIINYAIEKDTDKPSYQYMLIRTFAFSVVLVFYLLFIHSRFPAQSDEAGPPLTLNQNKPPNCL